MLGPMDALVLAGGMGTRLRPLTAARPKPLVQFMGEPYAAGLLRRLVAAGADRATFLVGRESDPWTPLAALGAQVGIAVEVTTEEEPLDTAGAVRRLLAGRRDATAGDVLVCNGDILTDVDLAAVVAAHRAAGATATLVLTRVEDTSAFGVVVTDGAGRVERFVEKPEPGAIPQRTVNAGTYVLAADAFDAFPGDGPLSFERTVFPGLLNAGRHLLGIVSDAYWADLGTPARYLAGTRAVLDGSCRWPVAEGFASVAPTVLVHETAQVAADADLGPHVVVGAGCTVGAGATVRGSVLHDDVRVGAGARVFSAILGHGASVAAGVEVGPDIVLGEHEHAA